MPQWGTRDARTIKGREVIERLDEIVKRDAPVMANRTADIIAQMFKFGIHREIVEDSPVKLLFKPGGKEKTRKRVLDNRELVVFVQGLPYVCRSRQKASLLRVLLLTLQRRAELGLAEWSEFDFEPKEWRIPDENAKNRCGHILPLTDWVMAELKQIKAFSKNSRFVVPSTKGDRPANPKLITRSVKRLQDRFKLIGIESPSDRMTFDAPAVRVLPNSKCQRKSRSAS